MRTRKAKTFWAEARAADEGVRLDRFLAQAWGGEGVSRTALQRMIRAGRVKMQGDGAATIDDPGRLIREGERFSLEVEPAPAAKLAAEAMDLAIHYEDEDLLVLDKPSGLAVHPGAGRQEGTLAAGLLAHCGAGLTQAGSAERPGIVHRLDMDTSGLMVVAKTSSAFHHLKGQFAAHGRDGALMRGYLALVRGVPAARSGRVEASIGRSPANRKKMAVRKGGRWAATSWRVKRAISKKAALLACTLESGRTHQVRVHLAYSGHPVLGDKLYGGKAAQLGGAGRQALHAAQLGFLHPADGRRMIFTSPLPADIGAIITKLEAQAECGL